MINNKGVLRHELHKTFRCPLFAASLVMGVLIALAAAVESWCYLNQERNLFRLWAWPASAALSWTNARE